MKTTNIIFFLFVTHFSSWSQNTIKTEIPCTDEILYKTPGRWLTNYGGLLDNGSEYLGFKKAQVKETTNRMDAVREMMFKIYPEPTGVDVAWHHTIGSSSFGEQVRYVKNSQGVLNREALVVKQVASFGFVSGFFRHYCNTNNPKEIWRGYPGETGTWTYVHSNTLGGETSDGGITIGGYPVCLRQPLIEKLGDFELLGIVDATLKISTGGITRSVIVHRKGMLPYIPVTRKQYLDKCIPIVTAFWMSRLKQPRICQYDHWENRKLKKKQPLQRWKRIMPGIHLE